MLRLLVLIGLLPVLLYALASEKFIQDVVDRHNYWRQKHGVPPVEADATISEYAQEWADYMAKSGKLIHRSSSSYGENIAFMYPAGSGEQYVDNLYVNEAKFYLDNKYCGGEPNMDKFEQFAHYTQIVWKGSTKIGVGKSGSYVAVNYSPGGNTKTQYTDNVPCLTS